VPKTEFKDLDYQFSIERIKNIPIELKNEFKTVFSVIDKEIINYYFDLKKELTINYVICIEGNQIGYSSIFEDETYWNLYEIYIKEEFRELGIGTKLFQVIKEDSKKINKKIRTYTLPSDRRAKNFYESNRITARILIMEEKRAGSRYKI
jgi:ribosomal protein S18 acetylase RimI-like enzyme